MVIVTDFTSACIYLCTIFFLYNTVLWIYRIYLSPLSHIPGPKLAAATSWYECFYDVWKRGTYYKKVKEIHELYGPIVRISPHEIHINDPEYYDHLNNSNGKWEKYQPYMAQFNSPGSIISTAQYDFHRMRRRPVNSFFSKRSINALEPRIYRHIDKLCERLDVYKEYGKPLTINHAALCFTGDVISEYALGESWKLLDAEDFSPWMLTANKKVGELSHTLKQFPWMVSILNAVPSSWISAAAPDVGKFLSFQKIAYEHVNRMSIATEKSNATVIGALLESDLPSSEKSVSRLAREAYTLIAAGGDTTGSTIALLIYHLVSNPEKLTRLKKDLAPVFPRPSWTQLEEIPYMAAVVKEGLRMNVGVISRVPRCAPDRDTWYKDYVIPRGTPVSMSVPDIHENPDIFHEPFTFMPERWLADDGKSASHKMDKWQCAFSKGTRQCLGINLAIAEIYLAVASLILRYDFELFETTREDVDWKHDWTVPQPAIGSKFIRAFVK